MTSERHDMRFSTPEYVDRALPWVLTVAVFAGAARADLTVGPPGSGADYDDLQAAIDAAPSGETLRLLPGHYEPAAIHFKGLRIIGPGPDQVVIGTDELEPEAFSVFSISGTLDDRDEILISGVTFRSDEGTRGTDVRATSVNGRLTFHDVVFETVEPPWDNQATVTLSSCSDVIFDDCVIAGYDPAHHSDPTDANGGPALHVLNFTRVALHRCRVTGGSSGDFGSGNVRAGAALWDQGFSTDITIHGGEYRGGSARVPSDPETSAKPAAALVLDSDPATLSGPPGTLFRGGDGYLEPDGLNVAGAQAVDWFSSLLVLKVVADGPSFEGGVGGNGQSATPYDVLPGLGPTELNLRFPGLHPSAASASTGAAFTLRLDGEPGALHAVYASIYVAKAFKVHGVGALAYLPPTSLDFLGQATLDAGGAAELLLQVPLDPALAGRVLWFQSVRTLPASPARWSLPTALRVD
ncbi:MAG: pectinesterase [Planctomycetota bacterium]